MSYNWSEFTVHTYVRRPVNELFSIWATCSGLERFFIKSARLTSPDGRKRGPDDPAQTGDEYHWRFMHEYELTGRIIEVNNNRSITFSFGSMEVNVEVNDVGGLSLVRLWQYNIPFETEEEKASSHLNCRSCWVFFLTNLKSVLESGHDLRESDPARSDCVAVHFKPPA